MDHGHGSSQAQQSTPLPDSTNCLKFGQKVYFANNSSSATGSSSSSSSSSPAAGVVVPPLPPPPAALGRRRKAAEAQPPRCQVEGCNVDLTGSKPYYCRHKVCGAHSKAPRVVVAGAEQRFCQQCSRFHQLTEFDQGKRSCRRRLAGHNERRRKPPPGPLSTRFGRFASSFPGDPSRYRGFMMDFAYARPPATSSRDLWPGARPMHTFPNTGLAHQPSSVVPAQDRLYPYYSGPNPSPSPSPLYPPDIPTDDNCLSVNSSCALSLLSTGPSSFPSGSGSHFVTNNNTQVGPHSSNMPASCEPGGPWAGFRASGPYVARGSGTGHELEFGGGELELALQRSGPQTDRESGHAFDTAAAGHGTNWPL